MRSLRSFFDGLRYLIRKALSRLDWRESIVSTTSVVYLHRKKGTVTKKIVRRGSQGVLRREVGWLRELADCEAFPKVLKVRKHKFVMTFCGDPIAADTIPPDWREQMEHILEVLERHGCCHNDVTPTNLLVLDGRIHLIDFGWATHRGEAVPDGWPKLLGGYYRRPEEFDDRYSFSAVMKTVLAKRKRKASGQR
jgi:predicted Ser/Thr protein kinase